MRSRALGNHYNPVDDEDYRSSAIIGKVKGSIFLYSSSKEPSKLLPTNMKAEMKVPVIVNTNLAPVLESAAGMFPPLRTCELLLIYIDLNCDVC